MMLGMPGHVSKPGRRIKYSSTIAWQSPSNAWGRSITNEAAYQSTADHSCQRQWLEKSNLYHKRRAERMLSGCCVVVAEGRDPGLVWLAGWPL